MYLPGNVVSAFTQLHDLPEPRRWSKTPANNRARNTSYGKHWGKIMFDKKNEYPWNSGARKPKEQSISQIIQKSREDGSCGTDRVNLRDLLVQRTMARHGFTEEQAMALILAFAGCVSSGEQFT
jgi:hypothetical protein